MMFAELFPHPNCEYFLFCDWFPPIFALERLNFFLTQTVNIFYPLIDFRPSLHYNVCHLYASNCLFHWLSVRIETIEGTVLSLPGVKKKAALFSVTLNLERANLIVVYIYMKLLLY